MGVSTSLDSIGRTFSAPPYVDSMAKYGANHLNDVAKTWLYIFTLGIANLYEWCNEDSMKTKEAELTEINYVIKRELDFYSKWAVKPSSFEVKCIMNGKPETLRLQEIGKDIEISLVDKNNKPVVVKYENFKTLHDKLSDELEKLTAEDSDIFSDSDYDPTGRVHLIIHHAPMR